MSIIYTLCDLSMEIDKYINDLDSSQIFNVLDVKPILERYNGNDWLNYRPCENCKKCELTKKTYRRMSIILPSLYSKEYDFYLLVWKNHVETGIHDHPKNGCLLKVLEGEISEEKYSKEGQLIESTNLVKGNIGFMNNDIGYHKIINPGDKVAYSLHIYSPPKYIPRVYQLDDLTPSCHI